MILNLQNFVAREKPSWTELDEALGRLEQDPDAALRLAHAQRLHYLYQRAGSSLAKLQGFPPENELRRFVEALVSRAYTQLFDRRRRGTRVRARQFLTVTWPRAFQRQLAAFWLALAVTLVGAGFGASVLSADPDSKDVIMPFSHLLGDADARVAAEESQVNHRLGNGKSTFAAQLMNNNISVSIRAVALGMTWGIGTLVLLFYNGVVLGAVAFDYISAGHWEFLFAGLLPHGAIEIPAILIAGQAGLVLGGALVGWGDNTPLRSRFRKVSGDVTTLIVAFALMLVWAGFVEAFFSQYHEPTIPYSLKIVFGALEGIALVALLWRRLPADDPQL